MSCVICKRNCGLYELTLYVMEWSDNVSGSRQVQQSRICGVVRIMVCEDCLREHINKKTKGFMVGKKIKEAAKDAIASRNYDLFISQTAVEGLKTAIDAPNAGKSKAHVAWAQANAADHLLNETFIPAQYVAACLVQSENGDTAFVTNEPIRYALNRPSKFMFIEYDPSSHKFQFVAGEQWIDPKWLMASEKTLRECKSFLNL